MRRYSASNPPAGYTPLPTPKFVLPKKVTVIQPMKPLEYISCPCPDSHKPSSLILRCREKEPHVMVMPKNFSPPPPEEPIDWKLIWKLNKLTRPQPPKNDVLVFQEVIMRIKNDDGTYREFEDLIAYPLTKIDNRPLNHHFMFVFKEMVMKINVKTVELLTSMIQGLIEVAVDMMVVTKLLDDVKTYEVVPATEPVNLYDTFCRYTYLAETTTVDDESILYKIFVIIKQDVINFWIQLGCIGADTKWLSLMKNLTRVIRDSAVQKITIETEALNTQLTLARHKIGDEGTVDMWKEFAELKSSRNHLIRKKNYLIALQ